MRDIIVMSIATCAFILISFLLTQYVLDINNGSFKENLITSIISGIIWFFWMLYWMEKRKLKLKKIN
ncbi:MAG: hypothetical protein HZB41_05690 [Ignavibacteriae bacterium]|nr:hypothetical protein [Ignavibacteriota bacterium]